MWVKNEVTQFPWLESMDFEQLHKLYALKIFNPKYLLSFILDLTFSFSPLPSFFFSQRKLSILVLVTKVSLSISLLFIIKSSNHTGMKL